MGNKFTKVPNPSVATQPQRTNSQPSIRITTSNQTLAQRITSSSMFSFLGPENLDTRETLRRLATNTPIRGFSYAKKFKFQTLFYQSSYSYCCCPCAYEHEYVTYISDKGEINEEILENIVECILKGLCPHVMTFMLNRRYEYVRDTKILAMHIAAAAGTAPKNTNFYNLESRASAIFGLRPEEIAMFHNNTEFVKEHIEHYKSWSVNSQLEIVASGLHYATRLTGDEYIVSFKYFTQTEFCIKNENRQLLQLVLDPFWTQHCLKALQHCFTDPGLADVQTDIMDYLRILRAQFKVRALSECAVFAIACDNDSALKCLLDILKTRKYADDLTIELPNICTVLGNDRQMKILSEYGYKGRKFADGDHFHLTMLHYLRKNLAETYYDQIKAAFDALPTSQEKAVIDKVYNNCGGLTPVHNAVFDLKPRQLENLLQMGADINIKSNHGETPLIQHLRKVDRWYVLNVKKFRKVLAILLYENPDVELNISAVEDGIKMDEFFKKRVSSQTFKISGTYSMDGQEHSLFAAEDGYALNFIAPLLMECGFLYTQSILTAALEKQLDSTELDYFRHYLNNPRSLQMSCRDVLRKHFKTRGIHKFVSHFASNIPEKIQDFILLKHVLTASQNFL